MLDLSKDLELIATVAKRIGMYTDILGSILSNLDKYPRVYHSSDHIVDLFKRILKGQHNKDEEKLLLITALFHDFVYDPKGQDNERLSAEAFSRHSSMLDLANFGETSTIRNFHLVYDTIVDTKDHIPRTGFSEMFCLYDLAGFSDDNDTVWANELKIRKEYAWVDWDVYKKGKLEFLKKYRENPIAKRWRGIQGGMDWVASQVEKEKTPNIGVYAGSFNPFHVGHLNIIRKAEKIFDKVVIAKGINPEKPFSSSMPIPEVLNYHQNDSYVTSLVAYLKTKSYNPTLIRGIRDTDDLRQEVRQLRWLEDLARQENYELNMVTIICDAEYQHISSSTIRAVEGFSDLEKLAEGYKL